MGIVNLEFTYDGATVVFYASELTENYFVDQVKAFAIVKLRQYF